MCIRDSQEPSRAFAVAYRDRMDERYDAARAIRDKRYLYIRHMMPYVPRGQYLAYLWRAPAAGAWQAHHREGKTNAITGRFFRPKPTEELYDTWHDPHSIHNLAEKPKYQNILAAMRDDLRQWQLQHFDAGLLPESEMVYRAAQNKMTIYEMIRNPQLYPLERLLDASDLALQREADVDLDQLIALLGDADSGIRYWGCVGLFRIGMGARGQKDLLHQLLKDPSDEVVAMAAWTLYNLGDEQVARDRLRGLLEENSRAALKVANMIDWMDEDLLRSCFIEDGFIDYGFYAGDAKGFIPAVMEVEKGGHSWHLISNVAIEINGDKAEVESYGLTSGGEITEAGIQDVNVYCGRYHDEFSKTPEGWKVSRRLYILDDNFSVKSEGIRGDLGGLFFCLLYTSPSPRDQRGSRKPACA